MTEEMVGWHHQLDGHEFEQAPGDCEGQGSLVCCSPWGCKERDMTEQLTLINYYQLPSSDCSSHNWGAIYFKKNFFKFFFFF